MTSATNERAIRERNARLASDRETDCTVITALMSTPDGRRWVWRRLEEARMFSGDEAVEPYRLAFDKGRRNAGLALLASVTSITPDMYVRMTSENTNIRLVEPQEPEADE